MDKEFYTVSDKIIFGTSWNPCGTPGEVLDGEVFFRILRDFLLNIEQNEVAHYREIVRIFDVMPYTVENITNFFKKVLKSDFVELEKNREKLQNFSFLMEWFIWDLYNFWRGHERYLIVSDDDKVSLIEKFDKIEKIILDLYRELRTQLLGEKICVFRQVDAGVVIGVSVCKQNIFTDYRELSDIQMISSVVFRPPVFLNNKNSTVLTDFTETNENPLDNLKINSNEWLLLPIKILDKVVFIYFHIDFISNGLTLSNIFKVVSKDEIGDKKPDITLIYGAKDGEKNTVSSYYRDTKNNIIIGYLNRVDDTDCFTYIKRMVLVAFGVKILEEDSLPFRGMLLNLTFKNDKTYNILMVGDSDSGKFELSQTLNTYLKKYIKEWKIVFNDIGFIRSEGNKCKVYNIERGIFIKLSALSGKGNFYIGLQEIIGRSIFITSDASKDYGNLINNNNILDIINDNNDVRIATLVSTTLNTDIGYDVDICINLLNK
ncbi:MAG: hypothetical protein LBC92_05335, partial [Rickettsiales bacterium]|nr:hypothetical protein [Rickettsiales bacterium]